VTFQSVRWGIKISRFSTNKSLYLANDTISPVTIEGSAGARVLEQGGHGQLSGGGGTWRADGARAYNGDLGAEPPAEPPVRGQSPPEAESFLALGCATDRANLYHLQYCQQSITTLWIVVGGGAEFPPVPPPAGADRRQIGNRTQAFKWYHFR